MNSPEIERARRHFLTVSVPEKRRLMVERAFNAELSPRAAIKAHCFVCSGMEVEEAKNCSVVLCPLYAYNGYRTDLSPKGEEESSASDGADG